MSFPTHILMTADTVGGVWTYSIDLAHALSHQGVRVSLATMGAPLTLAQRKEADSVNGLQIYDSSYKLEWMENPWTDVDAAGEWLLGLQRELQPDLIHLNGFAHGSLQWSTPAIIVGHSCVFSWWNAVRRSPAPRQWDEYKRRVRSGLRGADAIVAVSRFIASELERYYGPLRQVSTVYNSRNADEYKPWRKERFILSCGRVWDDAKNVRALDDAAERVQWPIYVAGEDKHPEGGRPTLHRVHAAGKLAAAELRSWYARAAIYVLPARYEPFGLSVLEAALSGCALVLGDTASLREIWHNAALFVPPDDHEALASALNSLVCRKELRDDLARRARVRALSFTAERMTQAYLDVYQQARSKRTVSRIGLSCAS
jgi:glycogen(starch) synthase